MFLFLLLGLIYLIDSTEIIKPDDFLMRKAVYGASAILLSSNSADIVYYSFSGASISRSYESNIYKVSIHIRTSIPFVSSESSKSKSYPKDRFYYGMFQANSHIYIYGGIDKSQVYNDLWRYDINDDSWKEIIQDDLQLEKFSPRYNFAHTFFTHQNFTYFIILGGLNQEKAALDDCMILKVDENNVISNESCDSFTKCTETGIAGGQLRYYAGKVYLFSGVNFENGEYKYFTDLCLLDFGGRREWERLGVRNQLVKSNNGGSSVYLDSLYYFFGAGRNCDNQGFVSNIYRLNLSSPLDGWSEIKINSKFEVHSFAYIQANDSIIIFGGLSLQGLLSSSSQISLKTLEVKTYEFLSPTKRIGSSLSRVSSNLILFGGESEHFLHNSLWEYNPIISSKASKWTKIRGIQTTPEIRKNNAATSQGDYLLIAGGEKQSGEFLNDFWLFDARYNNWTELVPNDLSERPTGFSLACIILKVPYFYLLGGINNQRDIMKEVWRYDLTLNTMIKMKNLTNQEFPNLYNFGCKYEKSKKWIDGKKTSKQNIFVYFGKNDNTEGLSCGVGRLEIKDSNYKYTQIMYNDKKMQCRSSAAYYYEKDKLMIVGGKGIFGNAFKDIWILEMNETHVVDERKSSFELEDVVHSASFESFNRQLYIISGFGINGHLSPSSASNLIYKVPLNTLLSSSYCDIGFEKINETCQICEKGSFSSKIENQCEKCEPIGTLTTTTGATAGIQCLIQQETVSNDFIKFFEQYLGFNSSDISQAPLYQPPDISLFYIIFLSAIFILLISFILAYKYSKSFYIFLNKKNMLRSRKYKKPKQITEPLLDRKSSLVLHEFVDKKMEEFNEKKQNKKKKNLAMKMRNQFKMKENFGGILTGLLIISVLGIVVYLVTDYIVYNQKEKSELIPTATFKKQFKKFYNKLTVDLVTYPFNYGSCSADLIGSSDLQIKTIVQQNISFTDNTNKTSYCCHIKFMVDKEDLYENDNILINFDRKNIYAKNIFVWVESESSKPGYISLFKQQAKSYPDQSLSGKVPTTFKYLLVPAYFLQESYFISTYNKSGTVVHTNSAPILGSSVQDHHLSVGSSLSVKLDLVGSESGMVTSVYLQIGLFKFISIMLTQVVGLFGIYGGFYILVQMMIKKYKESRKNKALESSE